MSINKNNILIKTENKRIRQLNALLTELNIICDNTSGERINTLKKCIEDISKKDCDIPYCIAIAKESLDNYMDEILEEIPAAFDNLNKGDIQELEPHLKALSLAYPNYPYIFDMLDWLAETNEYIQYYDDCEQLKQELLPHCNGDEEEAELMARGILNADNV